MRELAGGIAGQVGVIFVKLWRMECCQGAVLICPQRGKKGGVWELMTAELHIVLDKEL